MRSQGAKRYSTEAFPTPTRGRARLRNHDNAFAGCQALPDRGISNADTLPSRWGCVCDRGYLASALPRILRGGSSGVAARQRRDVTRSATSHAGSVANLPRPFWSLAPPTSPSPQLLSQPLDFLHQVQNNSQYRTLQMHFCSQISDPAQPIDPVLIK
jgi:hypothetical protein